MHIAIVNSEYPSPSGSDQGGIATYCYTLANTLAAYGHKIELLLREHTSPEKLQDSVLVHYYKFKQPTKKFRLWRFLNRDISDWEMGHSQFICDLLIKIHNEHKIDIVEFPDYGGLAAACHSSLPFPVVINFHTPLEIVDKFNSAELTRCRKSLHEFERKAIRKSQGFRCPSNALKSEICKLYVLPPSDVLVIRNPVSTSHFDSISKNPIQNRFDILFAGRLERRKGAEILIKTLPSILALNNNIYFTLAGNAEPGGEHCYRENLERALNREQRTRVFFSGPLNREDLSVLYCRSSLFLFPSLFENAPYSLFEAMAARLPVLASNCSAIQEIIKHGENGLLFNLQDENNLTQMVKYALSSYQRCCLMAEKAYEDLNQYYNPQRIADETLQFYQKIVANQNK